MEGAKIVVHYADGRLLKGTTLSFDPAETVLHVQPALPQLAAEDGSPMSAARPRPSGKPVPVDLGSVKAVFFVKDFRGDPAHVYRRYFAKGQRVVGLKLKVQFNDGEILVGSTAAYDDDAPTFFLAPADSESNTLRVFVVAAHTRQVTALKD